MPLRASPRRSLGPVQDLVRKKIAPEAYVQRLAREAVTGELARIQAIQQVLGQPPSGLQGQTVWDALGSLQGELGVKPQGAPSSLWSAFQEMDEDLDALETGVGARPQGVTGTLWGLTDETGLRLGAFEEEVGVRPQGAQGSLWANLLAVDTDLADLQAELGVRPTDAEPLWPTLTGLSTRVTSLTTLLGPLGGKTIREWLGIQAGIDRTIVNRVNSVENQLTVVKQYFTGYQDALARVDEVTAQIRMVSSELAPLVGIKTDLQALAGQTNPLVNLAGQQATLIPLAGAQANLLFLASNKDALSTLAAYRDRIVKLPDVMKFFTSGSTEVEVDFSPAATIPTARELRIWQNWFRAGADSDVSFVDRTLPSFRKMVRQVESAAAGLVPDSLLGFLNTANLDYSFGGMSLPTLGGLRALWHDTEKIKALFTEGPGSLRSLLTGDISTTFAEFLDGAGDLKGLRWLLDKIGDAIAGPLETVTKVREIIKRYLREMHVVFNVAVGPQDVLTQAGPAGGGLLGEYTRPYERITAWGRTEEEAIAAWDSAFERRTVRVTDWSTPLDPIVIPGGLIGLLMAGKDLQWGEHTDRAVKSIRPPVQFHDWTATSGLQLRLAGLDELKDTVLSLIRALFDELKALVGDRLDTIGDGAMLQVLSGDLDLDGASGLSATFKSSLNWMQTRRLDIFKGKVPVFPLSAFKMGPFA